ncbi:MAG: SpoIIE family protein phosphatase [Acidobacteria bacterium]|nr:SpoIIE family protein phosphatase [Acidobacteriota bacterium]
MKPDAVPVTAEARFLSTLVEINHEITSILDLDQLLNKIAELTHRIVPYEIFAILLVDEEKQELYHRFAIGHPPEVAKSLRIPLGDGVTGTAAIDRKPVIVDDVRKYPRYIEAVKGARSELAIPLVSKGRVVGVLDIESPEIGYFREEHVRLLNLLASQIAIAIENAKVYESERMNRELFSLLYDISLEVSSTLEVDELVHKIAAAVKSTINYHIFSIFLHDEKLGVLHPKFIIRSNEREFRKLALPLGTGLVGTAAKIKQALRVGDVTKDDRYLAVHAETRSELVVPLISKSRVVGVMDLESTEANYFTEYHERFLVTLASRVASALSNAELYARVSENERRMDREMKIAREIQHQLMPDELPCAPSLCMAVLFKPVAHLGGDLYDWLQFDDGRIAIVIGDVAGKGAPAALYGALSSGIIRTRAGRKYPPGQMLELVNKTLYERPIEGQYVALTYSIFDAKERKITLANSGLPYPLLVHEGKPTFLDVGGIPLGLFPDSKYQELELSLHLGDVLVLCSDGVIESRNESGEDFGLRRLADTVRNNHEKKPEEIVKAVSEAIEEFVGRAAPNDDRTMIVIKMDN